MKLGVMLPGRGYEGISGDLITRVAQGAEEAGIDSVWLGDHVALPKQIRSVYPHSPSGKTNYATNTPWLEVFTLLTFAAATTRRIRLGAFCVVPMRHPLLLAKVTATLDFLSGGRLILATGVGWMAEEFELLGVPFHKRGAITNESLEILKMLWAGTGTDYAGKLFQFQGVEVLPRPAQKPHPPIWVGGNSQAAFRRAAHFGDVIFLHSGAFSPVGLKSALAQVRQEASLQGRNPASIGCALRADADLRPQAGESAIARGAVAASPSQLVERLGEYASAGADYAVLSFLAKNSQEFLESFALLKQAVLPHIR